MTHHRIFEQQLRHQQTTVLHNNIISEPHVLVLLNCHQTV